MEVEYIGKEADWTEVSDNIFFYKDSTGTVWQLITTPFKEISTNKNWGDYEKRKYKATN